MIGRRRRYTRTDTLFPASTLFRSLHQRQREWIRLMEQQVTERTTTLERIVEGLDGLQQSRVSTIRGFSHDLRNPLFVVRESTDRSEEHTSELQSLMRISYAVFCLNKKPHN